MVQEIDWQNYTPRKGHWLNPVWDFDTGGYRPATAAEAAEKGHATLDGYTAFAELWGTPEGRIFWRLGNWGGFYHCEPLIHGSHTVKDVPPNAFLLMKDGEWVDSAVLSRSIPANEAEFYTTGF